MKYAISNLRSTVFFFKFEVDYITGPGKPDCKSPDCDRGEQ